MDPQPKLTKQGVRDLDHGIPTKRPAAIEPKVAASEAARVVSVSPAPAVPEGAVVSPIEK